MDRKLGSDGRLIAAGFGEDQAIDPNSSALPPNNNLVIYELPTSWLRETGAGRLRDVRALLEPSQPASQAYLLSLGVNALKLLPLTDTFLKGNWGYTTTNHFAIDSDLGFVDPQGFPTASKELSELVAICHQSGLRVFLGMVMWGAFHNPLETVNCQDFHILSGSDDPEDYHRDGFGGKLFGYKNKFIGYDPISGASKNIVPARQFLKTCLYHWMTQYQLDGIHIDAIANIGNWDFVEELRNYAHAVWSEQGGKHGRFLVVGEDLRMPMGLLQEGRIDALWNETFKRLLRAAILGQNQNEISFEQTIRSLVDCRLLGFRDGAEAVNYVTSHDVEGFGNERLCDFLANHGLPEEQRERRIKLAFVCLLTSVGIPMILAGEEFADEHGERLTNRTKQTIPVNFSRIRQPWRRHVFDYVARLVRLRTTSDALSVNDTEFIHTDFDASKRVFAWRRGRPGDDPVIVVANFSDWGTPDPKEPTAEYLYTIGPRHLQARSGER